MRHFSLAALVATSLFATASARDRQPSLQELFAPFSQGACRELPPGDKAFLARGPEGVAVLSLFDDGGEVCAVFEATDWLQRLVDQVGRGETGKRGQPL